MTKTTKCPDCSATVQVSEYIDEDGLIVNMAHYHLDLIDDGFCKSRRLSASDIIDVKL